MFTPPVTIRYRNSDLHVVPARHFCHIFADAVNHLCTQPATMPEAIAVELGPLTAAAAIRWLRNLGVGNGKDSAFPVMLALIKRNRMIRASFKEKAYQLQKNTGKDLSDLPPELLSRELKFSGHAVLFLSPVDSIIEALRCALELCVPVFGVDLEESAAGIYKAVLIPDPQAAGKDMTAYMEQSLPLAGTTRDEEIDFRREVSMAAHLKGLLQQHRRVLFTCGMAHWLKVRELLADESIRPASAAGDGGRLSTKFTRAVVHPQIAIRHMDLFPPLVRAYEKQRRPAGIDAGRRRSWGSVSAAGVFRSRMNKAYRKYFMGKNQTSPEAERMQDLESLHLFEGYLKGLSRLNHSQVPDLFTIAQAAQEMMSTDFLKAVAASFMEFPWTSRLTHPGAILLAPPAETRKEPGIATLIDSGHPGKQHITMLSILGEEPPRVGVNIPYEWKEEKEDGPAYLHYTWSPWEYLITAMSFRAIRDGVDRQPRRKTVGFEGSLLEGIDIKETLRSFSHGRENVYVRDSVYEKKPKSANPMDGFPVVWILNPGPHRSAGWRVLHEPARFIERHVRDRAMLKRIVKTQGDHLVAIIGYGQAHDVYRKLPRNQNVKADYYHGALLFQPLCFNNRQFARWAELTQYLRNPLCWDTNLDRSSRSDLRKLLEAKLGINLKNLDWATSLILMALPFSKESVTVVSPEGYRIENIVYEQARKYRVTVTSVSLEIFSSEQIERLAVCQLVPVLKVEPESRYSKSVERTIGELQKKNRDLVPPEWLNFGMRG